MKKTAFALCLLAAASASAATLWFDAPNRGISWLRPDVATHPETKQEFKNPSDGTLAACGIVQVEYEDCDFKYRLWGWEPAPWVRRMTQEERDERDARDVEAEAQAEAERHRPAEFSNGIVVLNGIAYFPSVPGGTNGWAVAVSPDGDVLTSHWYGSPTSTVSEIVVDLTEKAKIKRRQREAIRTAKAKDKGNKLQDLANRVTALEAERGVP